MTEVKREIFAILAQLVDFSIFEVFAGSDIEHLGTIGSGKELAFVVQELQCIPLTGVV